MSKHPCRFICLVAFAIIVGASLYDTAYGQKSKQRGVQDVSVPAKSTPGANYALVIGINNYKDLTKLETAVNDAKAVAQLLHDQYGFVTTVLIDADRKRILTELNTYRRTLPSDSNLLIYYAGHGYHDPATDKAYWMPVDAQKDNNENWISSDDITSDVKALPAMHVLIISDSCYSGVLSRDSGAGITPEDRAAYLANVEQKKSRNLMSSGGDEPVVDGGAQGHSLFASAVLDSLQHMKQDKFTAGDLFERRVKPSVAGRSEQVPQYNVIRNSGHDFGDFVFTRTAGSPRADTAAVPEAKAPAGTAGKQPKSNNGSSAVNNVVQQQSSSPVYQASAVVPSSGAAFDVPRAQPTPQVSVPNVPVQRFAVVHFGNDLNQFCIGWMTIQQGMIQYRGEKGLPNHGNHAFDFPMASIKEIKKNGFFGLNYQAFHIRTSGNATYNFSVIDISNMNNPRFLNPDSLLLAAASAASK